MHFLRSRITLKHRADCYHQLATLTTAALPLTRIFQLLFETTSHPELKSIYQAMYHALQNGMKLSECAAHHPPLFDPLSLPFLQLGESSGQLDQSLLALSELTQARHQQQALLIQLLTYPCFLFLSSSALLICLLGLVVPRFESLFQARLSLLPICTRFLFFIANHLSFFLITCVMIMLLFLAYALRYKMRALLHFSFLKPLIYHWQCLHVLRALTHGLAANLPLETSLRLASQFASVPHLKATLLHVREELYSGNTLSHALATQKHFPHWITALIHTGEESGTLLTMLKHAIHRLENLTHQQIRTYTHLLQPLILLLQGALIGGVVVSLYLPLFNLGTLY